MPTMLLAMLLAIDVDIIFFLLVAVIGLLNQVWQKVAKIRAESLRQQKLLEGGNRAGGAAERPEREAARKKPPLAVRPALETVRQQTQPEVVERDRADTSDVVPVIVAARQRLERIKLAKRARRRIPLPADAAAPSRKQKTARGTTGRRVANRLRGNRAALREAIVLREILGPPIALRGKRGSGGRSALGSRR